MEIVNMYKAKSTLSRLVSALESGEEREFVISRHGKPVARLLPVSEKQSTAKRIGVAKGKFVVPDDFDRDNEAIVWLFEGE